MAKRTVHTVLLMAAALILLAEVWKMLMKIIVSFTFYFIYWFVCYLATGTDKKNAIGLRSYPDAVRRLVWEHPEFCKTAARKKSILSVILGNIIIFTAVFSILGLILKKRFQLTAFQSAFWFFLALGEGLGLFDFVIIDLLWWRNTKRIRFSFLPEKKLYQDPEKHIGSFLR